MTSQLMTQVIGVEFLADMQRINSSYINQEFNLDVGRAMHQSCIVSGPNGKRLLLVGGRTGNTLSTSEFSATVIGYDLKYVLQPGLRARVESDKAFKQKFDPNYSGTVSWENLAPMKSSRANFALSVFKNQVFVYGGIQGKGQGD